MNKSSVKNILFYLSPLIIIGLITGPLVPEIIMNLSVLLFIYILYLEKNFEIYKNKLFLFLLLFFIYIVLNSFFTEKILISLKSSLFYFRFFLFAFCIHYLIINIKNDNYSEYFYVILKFSIIIVFVFGLLEFFFDINFLNVKNNPEKLAGRVSGLFGDEYIMGSYLFRITPIFFCLNLYLKKSKIELIVISFLVFLGIFFSGERTSLVFLILFYFFSLLILEKSFKKLLAFVGVVLILSSIISFYNKSIFIRYINITMSQIFPSEGNKNRYVHLSNLENPTFEDIFDNLKSLELDKIKIFSQEHENHMKIAYKIYLDNQLFGVGLKMFRYECEKYSKEHRACSTHPHNTAFQFISELGIIGFSFSFCVYIFLIKNICSARNYNYEKILYLGVFISIFPLLPNGNFFNNWFSMITYLPLGYLIYFTSKKND